MIAARFATDRPSIGYEEASHPGPLLHEEHERRPEAPSFCSQQFVRREGNGERWTRAPDILSPTPLWVQSGVRLFSFVNAVRGLGQLDAQALAALDPLARDAFRDWLCQPACTELFDRDQAG